MKIHHQTQTYEKVDVEVEVGRLVYGQIVRQTGRHTGIQGAKQQEGYAVTSIQTDRQGAKQAGG